MLTQTGKTVTPEEVHRLANDIFAEGPCQASFVPTEHVIPLPFPVLNVWSYGKAADLLGLSKEDVDDIVYYSRYLVVKECGEEKQGIVLSKDEMDAAEAECASAISLGTGTEALIKYAKVKGMELPGVIDNIPVIYPTSSSLKGQLVRYDFSYQYAILMERISRLNRLKEINAPGFITCETKALIQKGIDSLLHNGLKGELFYGYADDPLYSFQDLANKIL